MPTGFELHKPLQRKGLWELIEGAKDTTSRG